MDKQSKPPVDHSKPPVDHSKPGCVDLCGQFKDSYRFNFYKSNVKQYVTMLVVFSFAETQVYMLMVINMIHIYVRIKVYLTADNNN